MGGIGSGGRRPGSGRKPKSEAARALDGNAGHRGRVLQHPKAAEVPAPAPLPVVDETDAPNDLNTEERLVWLELAPHALANGTLTKATSLAFRLLCKNVVLERLYAASVNDRGGANHRGMIQRIDAELLRFNLAPCGKRLEGAEPARPQVDPRKAKYLGGSGSGA